MANQSYYRDLEDNGCNEAVSDKYLVVNCAGVYGLSEPFEAYNPTGRRDIYLMFLLSGSLDIELDGKKCKLHSGEAAFYPANKPYRYSKADTGLLTYYWVHFTGYAADEILKSCGFLTGEIYSTDTNEKEANHSNKDKIISLFKRLFQHFYLRDSLFEPDTAACLIRILSELARAKSPSDLANATGYTPSTERIRTSLEYLYCNYAKPITLAILAGLEHLSVSRYSAVFKQCMGISPQGFLIELRIKNAADLLSKTNLSVKQVAQITGYDDPLYFSVLFKRKIGVSPSRYQKES